MGAPSGPGQILANPRFSRVPLSLLRGDWQLPKVKYCEQEISLVGLGIISTAKLILTIRYSFFCLDSLTCIMFWDTA